MTIEANTQAKIGHGKGSTLSVEDSAGGNEAQLYESGPYESQQKRGSQDSCEIQTGELRLTSEGGAPPVDSNSQQRTMTGAAMQVIQEDGVRNSYTKGTENTRINGFPASGNPYSSNKIES